MLRRLTTAGNFGRQVTKSCLNANQKKDVLLRAEPVQRLAFLIRRSHLTIYGMALIVLSACGNLPGLSDTPEEELHSSESPAQGPADLIYGQAAAARGDWNKALAFFQRSYREKPSVLNEFNLATAYQRTGQGALAVPLYLDLIDRGGSTEVTPIQNADESFDQRAPASDIADEARDRLIKMHAMDLSTAGAGQASAPQRSPVH
jgi:hypothetical protein